MTIKIQIMLKLQAEMNGPSPPMSGGHPDGYAVRIKMN